MKYTNANIFGGIRDELLETGVNEATAFLKGCVQEINNVSKTNEVKKEGGIIERKL